ncbi:MAG TPA: YitT family protein [Candidatus Aveggerthella excrementigallinarum]|nr:YitT family protein [Candidatus Aveggerthella excrementigallinarum]
MALRYLWFIVGVLVNSFGIALITKAALGTSPISSVAYVLSLALPLTIGQFTFIMNMVFIALQPVLLRREYRPIQVLQIAVNVVFSAFLDVSMGMLSWLDPTTLPAQLAALLVGCAILGVGVAVEVAPDVLMVPGEGLVRAIYIVVSRRFGSARFGTIKNLFDISLMLIAVVLSLAFFGYLNGIGVGTVIAALLVGRIVNLTNDHLPLIPYIKKLR